MWRSWNAIGFPFVVAKMRKAALTMRNIYFYPDLLGTYEITVTVTTDSGASDSESISIRAVGDDLDGDAISDDFDPDDDNDGVLDFEDLDPRDPSVGLAEGSSSSKGDEGGCSNTGAQQPFYWFFALLLSFRRRLGLNTGSC
jgi:hypothetical protein